MYLLRSFFLQPSHAVRITWNSVQLLHSQLTNTHLHLVCGNHVNQRLEAVVSYNVFIDGWCRFPLSRSAARTKVQPPFSPRCDGSDIRHVKAGCGMDCGCACSVPAHEPNNFAKREASSLFADAEGRNLRNIFNILPDNFNYCSSNYEINKHYT